MQHFLEPELEGLEEVQFQGPDLELGSTISAEPESERGGCGWGVTPITLPLQGVANFPTFSPCLCVGSEGPREQHHVLAFRTSEGTETCVSQECPVGRNGV